MFVIQLHVTVCVSFRRNHCIFSSMALYSKWSMQMTRKFSWLRVLQAFDYLDLEESLASTLYLRWSVCLSAILLPEVDDHQLFVVSFCRTRWLKCFHLLNRSIHPSVLSSIHLLCLSIHPSIDLPIHPFSCTSKLQCYSHWKERQHNFTLWGLWS